MKLKKVIALILAMCMVLSAAACGTTNEDIRGEIKNDGESIDNEDGTSEEEDEIVLSVGVASGSVYESEFMNIGWTLPEGWTFMTEEEMATMNQVVADMLGNEDIASQIEDGETFCDMSAYNAVGETINIQIEKMAATTALTVDEVAYADIALEQLPAVFEPLGYSVKCEKQQITLAGKTCEGVYVELGYQGAYIYEKMALIKVGQYMCVITVASASMDVINAIYNNFYELN